MRRNKKKHAKTFPRRALRIFCQILVAFLLYSIIGAYAPFAICPVMDAPSTARATVEQMQQDQVTSDRVMVLSSHADALDERIRLMNTAQHDLIISIYDLRDGESTRDVLCVALERAEAGVRVRLLVDGISGWLRLSSNELFQALETHPNIEIRFYNPLRLLAPWHHMGRMHDKYVIVDDVGYILGGRNMFDSFIGTYSVDVLKDDREVLIYNAGHSAEEGARSSVYQLIDYFEGIWNSDAAFGFIVKGLPDARRDEICISLLSRCQRLRQERPDLFEDTNYSDMTEPTKGVWLLSNPTGVYAKRPVLFTTLCALMQTAQSEVVIHTPYAVLNTPMREALTEVAAAVPVTLMVNAIEHSHNTAASSDYLHHRSEVLSTGVRLLEYAGDNYYHGKAVLIDDDLSVIGCYNLDLRSTYVDTELMLVIRGKEMNELLRGSMDAMHSECRTVRADGSVEMAEGMSVRSMPAWKRAALWILGVVMQPLRNLL